MFMRQLVIALGALAVSSLAAAQPSIPQSSLPANAPPDVRKHVARLYSEAPVERVEAVIRLGDLGEKAAAGIPFLVAMFDDQEMATLKVGVVENETWTGEQAVRSLVKIGPAAVEPLIPVLTGGTEHTRVEAAKALGRVGDRRAIGPLVAAARANDDNHSCRLPGRYGSASVYHRSAGSGRR